MLKFLSKKYDIVKPMKFDPQMEQSSIQAGPEDDYQRSTTPGAVLKENLKQTGKSIIFPAIFGFYTPFIYGITYLEDKGLLDNRVVRGVANGVAGVIGVGLGTIGAALGVATAGLFGLKNQVVDTGHLFAQIAAGDKLVVAEDQ